MFSQREIQYAWLFELCLLPWYKMVNIERGTTLTRVLLLLKQCQYQCSLFYKLYKVMNECWWRTHWGLSLRKEIFWWRYTLICDVSIVKIMIHFHFFNELFCQAIIKLTSTMTIMMMMATMITTMKYRKEHGAGMNSYSSPPNPHHHPHKTECISIWVIRFIHSSRLLLHCIIYWDQHSLLPFHYKFLTHFKLFLLFFGNFFLFFCLIESKHVPLTPLFLTCISFHSYDLHLWKSH